MLFPSGSVLNVMALASVSMLGLQASVSPMFGAETQNVIAACAVAMTILTLVYGVGKLVERLQNRGVSNASRLKNDDDRFKAIELLMSSMKDMLTSIKEQITINKTDIEKDLIARRAAVDRQIHDLQNECAANKGQLMGALADWKKTDERLVRLNERVRPWLRVFEADGSRSLKKAYGIPLDEQEETTDSDC
jgi:hypothetical protein